MSSIFGTSYHEPYRGPDGHFYSSRDEFYRSRGIGYLAPDGRVYGSQAEYHYHCGQSMISPFSSFLSNTETKQINKKLLLL